MRKSKNRYFYQIFVSPGDAPGAITLNVVWMEREFDAYKFSRSMYPSIFNSFPDIRTARAKKRHFHVPQPTFLFPCDYHAISCMNGKTIQCSPNPSQHVPIYIQLFPSYTMLKSMRKSKNRYFYHIFVSPGDAPGAPTITLNVVWMEREFDAYKLSPASAHLPVTVSEIERDIGQKSPLFHTPFAFDLPLGEVPVGIAPPRLVWKN